MAHDTSLSQSIRKSLEADADYLERMLKKRDAGAIARVRTGLGMSDATAEDVVAVGRSRLLNVVAHSIGHPTWNSAAEAGFEPRTAAPAYTGRLASFFVPNDGFFYQCIIGDLEEREHKGMLQGNAHHLAQKLAAKIVGRFQEQQKIEMIEAIHQERPRGLTLRDTQEVAAALAGRLGLAPEDVQPRLELNMGAFDFDAPDGTRYVVWANIPALHLYLAEWKAWQLEESDEEPWSRLARSTPEALWLATHDVRMFPFRQMLEEKGYTEPELLASPGGRVFVVVTQ